MSFGEPNNPYGPPSQQPPAPQQPPAGPGYGYPQQGPPPGAPQQGYGVPQAPPPYPQQQYGQQPYPQYPGDPQFQGGYPGGPLTMPGITRAARILLGVIALAHAVIAGSYLWVLSRWDQEMREAGVTGDPDAEQFADLGKGVVIFFLGLATVFTILGVVLLLQYAKGGNSVRVCSIVYGSFAIITGIFMIAAWGLGLIVIAVAVLLIVFSAKRATADWFRRPRY